MILLTPQQNFSSEVYDVYESAVKIWFLKKNCKFQYELYSLIIAIALFMYYPIIIQFLYN